MERITTSFDGASIRIDGVDGEMAGLSGLSGGETRAFGI